MTKKILVLGDRSYARPLEKFAAKNNLRVVLAYDSNAACFAAEGPVKSPGDYALILFTGGADVSPHLYGEESHRNTYTNPDRDAAEEMIFKAAKENGIPMAGICRGSQFLCVMAGGKLVQDLTGHAGVRHPITVVESGEEVVVTSTHHQMQYPFDLDEDEYEVVAHSTNQLSREYWFNNEQVVSRAESSPLLALEPDIVYYPKIKALAAQYHPEMMNTDSEGFNLFGRLVEQYLQKEITSRVKNARTKTAG